MTKDERIFSSEKEIKRIFAKDVISKIDVFIANKHFETWKVLTDYIPDSTPVLCKTERDILDQEPIWKKN